MFEGIGGVMPIYDGTADKKEFPNVLVKTVVFLTSVYIVFATLCYYTFGKDLHAAIVMEMMPPDNTLIQVVKFLFMINLVFSYPLTIFITNIILESFTFKSLKKNSTSRTWLKNF